jgi:hypothetical protein
MDKHKHLGIILQKDGKWGDQVQVTVTKATRRIDILRNLSYKIDRDSLNKLYVAYIRPVLEQGCIVWNNCNQGEAEILEKTQRQAARAVCGAKKGTSHIEIYNEVKWEPLKERRDRQCLIMLYKMKHNLSPDTLSTLIPNERAERTTHNIRNRDRLTIPKANTTQYQNSFLPSTIQKWNQLPIEIRQATSLEQFKESITPEHVKPPTFYNEGTRREQILFCRLRVNNADLNQNLNDRNLVDSPECECGHGAETTTHYFLDCNRFNDQRRELQNEIVDIGPQTVESLLKGNNTLTENQNRKMHLAVQKFITESKRFDPT